MSVHHSRALAQNTRPGFGRGPAPTEIPERLRWRRWRMFDELMWDALDGLDAAATVHIRRAWPKGWPTPESGLLSIRQMEWVRVHMIEGRHLDARARLFA